MSTSLVTPPAVEPVTLAEAKKWINMDDDITENDDLIADLIVACREDAEEYCGRALITQTRQICFDAPPYFSEDMLYVLEEALQVDVDPLLGPAELPLPYAPLQSIKTFTWFDTGDNPNTLDPSVYRVDSITQPGRIVLRAGESWPTPLRPSQSFLVVYICGYGDNPTDVPSAIRTAIKMMTAFRYENRDAVDMPPGAQHLLDRYRLPELVIG